MKNILKIAFLTLNSASLLASDTNNLVRVEQALQGLGHTYDYLTSHDFTAKKKALTPSPPIPPTVSTPVTGPVIIPDSSLNLVDLEQALKAKGYDYGAMLVMNLAAKIAAPPTILHPATTISLSSGFYEYIAPAKQHRSGLSMLERLHPTQSKSLCAHVADIEPVDFSFFGLYNAPNNKAIANYIEIHLYDNIRTDPNFSTDIVAAIIQGCVQTYFDLTRSDESSQDYGDTNIDETRSISRAAFMDESKALFAFIKDHQLYVGNVGNDQAVISTLGASQVLSTMHTYGAPEEKARIDAYANHLKGLYGYDSFSDFSHIKQAVLRISNLTEKSNSRAFGNASREYFSYIPSIKKHTITNNDDFLILASASLWDALSSQQAVDLVKAKLAEYDPRDLDSEALNSVAKGLVDGALAAGSKDNVSAIVVKFR